MEKNATPAPRKPGLSTHGQKKSVPAEVFAHWRRVYRFGDSSRAAKESGYSRVVIQNALLYGYCQDPVLTFLNSFFKTPDYLVVADRVACTKAQGEL